MGWYHISMFCAGCLFSTITPFSLMLDIESNVFIPDRHIFYYRIVLVGFFFFTVGFRNIPYILDLWIIICTVYANFVFMCSIHRLKC